MSSNDYIVIHDNFNSNIREYPYQEDLFYIRNINSTQDIHAFSLEFTDNRNNERIDKKTIHIYNLDYNDQNIDQIKSLNYISNIDVSEYVSEFNGIQNFNIIKEPIFGKYIMYESYVTDYNELKIAEFRSDTYVSIFELFSVHSYTGRVYFSNIDEFIKKISHDELKDFVRSNFLKMTSFLGAVKDFNKNYNKIPSDDFWNVFKEFKKEYDIFI